MRMTGPEFTELNFFCTLEAKALARLFEDRFVLDDLKSLGAGVSLAVMDFLTSVPGWYSYSINWESQ